MSVEFDQKITVRVRSESDGLVDQRKIRETTDAIYVTQSGGVRKETADLDGSKFNRDGDIRVDQLYKYIKIKYNKYSINLTFHRNSACHALHGSGSVAR